MMAEEQPQERGPSIADGVGDPTPVAWRMGLAHNELGVAALVLIIETPGQRMTVWLDAGGTAALARDLQEKAAVMKLAVAPSIVLPNGHRNG